MKLKSPAAYCVVIALLCVFSGCQKTPDVANPVPATAPATAPASAPDIMSLEVGQEAELFNGHNLTGWNVASKDWFSAPGDVGVKNGLLSLGYGSDLTGVQWSGEMLRNDYVITLEARRTKGLDFFCGLTFPVNDSHVTLILGGWGGTAVGLSNVNDMSAIENEGGTWMEFTDDKWYDVEVRVTEDHIRVFIDGKKVIDQEIKENKFTIWPQMEDVRPLGVATYCTVGEFRRIAVMRMPDSQ